MQERWSGKRLWMRYVHKGVLDAGEINEYGQHGSLVNIRRYDIRKEENAWLREAWERAPYRYDRRRGQWVRREGF